MSVASGDTQTKDKVFRDEFLVRVVVPHISEGELQAQVLEEFRDMAISRMEEDKRLKRVVADGVQQFAKTIGSFRLLRRLIYLASGRFEKVGDDLEDLVDEMESKAASLTD